MQVNQAIFDKLCESLKRFSSKQWEEILRNEPEWKEMKPVLKQYPKNAFLVLMLVAGLNTYQLKGGAEKNYWPKLANYLLQQEVPASLDALLNLLKPFYAKERLNKRVKSKRIW